MSSPTSRFVTGLVLGAGGSRRLGRPKQLLPYGSGSLLGHVLDTARACRFDELLCVIGGSGDAVAAQVEFDGVRVVRNDAFGAGCSSSIAAAVTDVDRRSDVLVLLLGDQPGVSVATVRALVDGRGDAALAACGYTDGRGHPLACDRSMYGELGALRGDKAVWKLLERHGDAVIDVPVDGSIPLDVDTWEDYQTLLQSGSRTARPSSTI